MPTENGSGLKPVGRAVLVQTYEPELKSSVIEIPAFAKERMAMLDQRAQVVEIGENAWYDEPGPRACVGDKVLIAKFAGYMAVGPADGKPYRLINDRDIFACITAEQADEAD